MSGSGAPLEADFVVVGAGSAGCVMAARLSEDPATSVILLEAGGEDTNFWIHIPLGYGKTFADKRVNWMFQTEPDPGANNRSIYWPRGKVLGGSSSINGMVYIRGQHEDFDHWRQLGNPGWSAADVLPYFKRAEHQTRGQDDWHGTDGTLAVSDASYSHPICDAFIDAAVELGFPRNDDFNGEKQEGVGYQQTTTRKGRRCSTAVGYLHPAMKRPNLRVITRALTERVLFDGKRAVGHRVPRERRAENGARAARGDPVRRRDRLTAYSAAVRRRAGGASGGEGRRGRARSARRRAMSAGPLLGGGEAALQGEDHLQRRDDESVEATRRSGCAIWCSAMVR